MIQVRTHPHHRLDVHPYYFVELGGEVRGRLRFCNVALGISYWPGEFAPQIARFCLGGVQITEWHTCGCLVCLPLCKGLLHQNSNRNYRNRTLSSSILLHQGNVRLHTVTSYAELIGHSFWSSVAVHPSSGTPSPNDRLPRGPLKLCLHDEC